MPWREVSGGFTKKTKSGKGGGFVKNPAQYEKLKAKYGKERAAKITNASNFRHPLVSKSDEPESELEKRFVSENQRAKLHSKGRALKPLKGSDNGGRFPINSAADLANAKRAIGRAKPSTRAAVRAHINRQAKRLGEPKIGKSWEEVVKSQEQIEIAKSLWCRDQVDKALGSGTARRKQGQWSGPTRAGVTGALGWGGLGAASAAKKGKKLRTFGLATGRSTVEGAGGSLGGYAAGAALHNPQLGRGLSGAGSIGGGIHGAVASARNSRRKGYLRQGF